MSTTPSAPSSDQIKLLIDGWLRAELDRDAILRRRTDIDREGVWHPGIIMERTPEGIPEKVIRYLDEAQVTALEETGLPLIEAPQYVLTDVNEVHLERGQRYKVLEESRDRFKRGDTSIAARHVAELFQAHGASVGPESDEFDLAARLMTRAHRDLLAAIGRRDIAAWRPNLDDDPADELIRRLGQPQGTAFKSTTQHRPPVSRRAGMRFSEAARQALLALAKAESFKSKRRDDYENAIRTFIDWREADPLLGDVTAEAAGDYQVALGFYPTNVRKRPEYRLLTSFAERCARADELDDECVLSAETINTKYLAPLRRIYDWHEKAGSGLTNPFKGIAAPKPRVPNVHDQRRDFSVAELQRLFDLPLFTGSAGPKWGPLYRPGPVRVSDWRFWVPLICIFSGMRLNEACGLALADVKIDNGIAFFHCRDELEGQSVKAAASRRRVPIHPSLIEIGLLEHVSRLRANGRVRLFDELKVDSDGYFSGKPSKFFLSLIGRIEDESPEEPGRLVFHSTRHTATTRLRAAGVRMDVSEAVIGHESVGTHSAYGSFDIPTLKQAVDQIVYPGLDLTRVRLPLSS